VGAHHRLRDPREGLHPPAPHAAGGDARHLCRPRRAGGRDYLRASASPRWSCCRSTPSSTTASCSRRA
jgi:hypothetical protein